MIWKKRLNEIIDLGDKVQYKIFADGWNLELSLDGINFIKPNIEKKGIKGFDVIVDKNNKELVYFHIKELGCLSVLYKKKETKNNVTFITGCKNV